MSSRSQSMSEEPVLGPYLSELEEHGLTIVPPEVTGVDMATIDRCVEVLLARFTELTGCPISLEEGPLAELTWPAGSTIGFARGREAPDPTQALIQQLLQVDRCFRDLAVNPVVDQLVDHMIGPIVPGPGHRARRLSSANAFIKWPGDYGYGPKLGLHCDQNTNPLPWGSTALTANATWALTDYSHAGGALAYVPGSHRLGHHPEQPQATRDAVAAEAPRGSCIVFHGATWHGAFPKKTPGLRLCAVSYYRHQSVLPQELMKLTMAEANWADCDDPEMMRELIGFDDSFPYFEQNFPLPKRA